MPNYALRYQATFDGGPGGLETYTVQFWLKGYTGDFANVTAAGVPVVHKWDKDEPKPGIKGSSIDVQLINPGNFPLSTFFSVEDDTWQVIFLWGTQVLFAGYLVQDDCTEVMLDGRHGIQLSATDNLGLLKGVSLLEASRTFGPTTTEVTNITINFLNPASINISKVAFTPQVGDGLVITNSGTALDGVPSTIKSITDAGASWQITLTAALPISGNYLGVSVTYQRTFNLQDRLNLAAVVGMCLNATGLLLNVNVYATLQPDPPDTGRWLEDTYVTGEYFLNGNTWLSSYEVLTQVFERFNATLFQAEGVWNIMRWDEQRYYANAINGSAYDPDMTYTGEVLYNDIFTSGFEEPIYPEQGLTQSILRPFKFVRKTFNYKQPANLLKNANLQILGAFRTSYAVGTDTWSEYEMPYWFVSSLFPVPAADYFIRVITDNLGGELARYAVVRGPSGDDPGAVQSTAIEVNEGDIIKFSDNFRSTDSQPGSINVNIDVRIDDGTNIYYIRTDGQWIIGSSYTYNIPSGDNMNQWHDVTIQSKPSPVSGLLYVSLAKATPSNAPQETQHKDISLEIIFAVNESTRIIGQVHTSTQELVIKNNEDTEIMLDDSPRNSINGTLLLSTTTGLVRDRTNLWGYAPGGTRRLGQITTFEQLFWRRIPRSKLEGTFYGLVQYQSAGIATNLYFTSTGSVYIIILYSIAPEQVTPGTVITITGSTAHDGSYTVSAILSTSPTTVRVIEPVAVPPNNDSGLVSFYNKRHISMLTLMLYTGLPRLNFIFGVMSIDYRFNNFNGTLWELWQDGEEDDDLASGYEFKYLYNTGQ